MWTRSTFMLVGVSCVVALCFGPGDLVKAQASLPLCVGGPFTGPQNPTTPPGRPTCKAVPTMNLRGAVSAGPVRIGQPLDPGYHTAGSGTNYDNYLGTYSSLQVQNPDLSQSGPSALATEWVMVVIRTPDYAGGPCLNPPCWIQAGWIKQQPVDARRVFMQVALDGLLRTNYFDQYPISDGQNYYFSTHAENNSSDGTHIWNALLWWGGSWNLLDAQAGIQPRFYQSQQYYETYTSTGIHPQIAQIGSADSHLQYQLLPEQWQLWDLSVPTSYGPIACGPNDAARVDFPQFYYNWNVNSCP
jgi:hypothetical protein